MEPAALPENFALFSAATNFLWLLVKILVISFLLGRFDKRMGLDWKKEVYPHIEKNTLSIGNALYFGLRFIGICYVAGSV